MNEAGRSWIDCLLVGTEVELPFSSFGIIENESEKEMGIVKDFSGEFWTVRFQCGLEKICDWEELMDVVKINRETSE